MAAVTALGDRGLDRRALIVGAIAVLAAPLAAEAQQATTTYRVGLFAGGLPPSHRAPLTEALRELGYVEGQNLLIESRYAEGRPERLPSLAAELVQAAGELWAKRWIDLNEEDASR